MSRSASESAREQFHDAIQTTVTNLGDDHAAARGLLTNFVLVCEMMGDDGRPWLFMVDSDQPTWRTQGLLLSAQQILTQDGTSTTDSSDGP